MSKDRILEELHRLKSSGGKFSAAAGFDAVIDMVVRPVREKYPDGRKVYFHTIEEFARYLLTKTNRSCSVDLELQEEKIGGNMAIFSNALGQLGIQVHCIGSMGYPEVSHVFQEISENCTVHTVCQTAQCSALEFNDGKIMLSSMDALNDMTWSQLTQRLERSELTGYFGNSHLTALLNWSELNHATSLYRMVFEQAIKPSGIQKDKLILFDLSDASRKPDGEIKEILELIKLFTEYRTTIFSVNENEVRLIAKAVFGSEEGGLPYLGERISSHLQTDYFIIHLLDQSMAFSKKEAVQVEGYFIDKPKISTGGGDNFNAGLCIGFLNGCPLNVCLELANAVSGYYVRMGNSPTLKDLYLFIQSENVGGE